MYEVAMQAEILALLKLFRDQVPDPASNVEVTQLIADRDNWSRAHDLFDVVRGRLLQVPEGRTKQARVRQYEFEEYCLKAAFNETATEVPFDSCSPYWVAGSAFRLARALGISSYAIIAVIASED
jgi:hypothetical protein